jgi:hypothetical protein
MPDYDVAIRGVTVTTASDSYRADIAVREGRIAAIAERIAGASREIDASGLIVMPGGIDSHVHLAQPTAAGLKMADDFFSGTRAAIAGGNTTVLPFALQPRDESGGKYVCSPPPRDRVSWDAIWEGSSTACSRPSRRITARSISTARREFSQARTVAVRRVVAPRNAWQRHVK